MVVNMKILIFINHLLLFEMTGISISKHKKFRELVALFEESMCCWGMYGKLVRECAALSDSSWQAMAKQPGKSCSDLCFACAWQTWFFFSKTPERKDCFQLVILEHHFTVTVQLYSKILGPQTGFPWISGLTTGLICCVFFRPETLPNSLAELLIVTMPSTNLQALDGFSVVIFRWGDRTLIAQYFGPFCGSPILGISAFALDWSSNGCLAAGWKTRMFEVATIQVPSWIWWICYFLVHTLSWVSLGSQESRSSLQLVSAVDGLRLGWKF